jgi:hypothetical protein
VDLIDLEDNQFKSLPVEEVLSPRYPALRYLTQIDQGDYLLPLRSNVLEGKTSELVLTFDELLRRTPFARRLREILKHLEEHYHSPVDTEFTLQIIDPLSTQPEVDICLLQCRPQSQLKERKVRLPSSLNPADVVFSTRRVVPEGHVEDIRFVVFVTPEGYFSLPTQADRAKVGRLVGQLNAQLAGKTYICIGPGRWGTSNPDLGVPIGYGDIYNTRALIEISGQGVGAAPEPSFGTHFFQDLIESNIFPLAIYLDDPDVAYDHAFFYDTPNLLSTILPEATRFASTLRLIDVASFRPAHHLELVMDDEKGQALAYLVPDD